MEKRGERQKRKKNSPAWGSMKLVGWNCGGERDVRCCPEVEAVTLPRSEAREIKKVWGTTVPKKAAAAAAANGQGEDDVSYGTNLVEQSH